jgi:hypothetical protein
LELPLQDYPLTIPVSNFVEKLLPALKLDVIHAHHPALLGQVAAKKAEDLEMYPWCLPTTRATRSTVITWPAARDW